MKHHRILAVILCLVLVIGLSTAAFAADPYVDLHRFFIMDTDDYYAYGLGGYDPGFAKAQLIGELTADSDLVPSQCYAYAHVQGKDSNGRPWVFEIDEGTLTAVAKGNDNGGRILYITCYFEWLDHIFPEEDFQY